MNINFIVPSFFPGLTCKSLYGLAPMYINEVTSLHSLSFSCSNDSNFLATPKTTAVTYGDRSFAVITPKLWNQVPLATLFSLKMVNFTNQDVMNYKHLLIELFTSS